MPIYEFECASCGKRSDHLMRLSDPDPSACPECGATQLKRVLSAPQFRLAGAGWYETDFKGDKDRKRNIAGDSGDKSGDARIEAKPDAKPEAKSESKPDSKPEAKSDSKPESKPAPKSDAPASAAPSKPSKPDSAAA